MKFQKLPPSKKEEMRRAVLLLRFRWVDPGRNARRYMTHAKIATALNLSVNEVAYLCVRAQSGKDHLGRRRDPARALEQVHINFMTCDRTLQLQAGKTLAERSALFTAMFPDKKIAVTTLRLLYLKHGIKRKRVAPVKVVP